MKIKFNLDDDLPLNKTLKLQNMIIVVTAIFHDGSKYYPRAFLDESLFKLWMLEFDRNEVSQGIDFNKTDGLHECIISHYWSFFT